MLKDYVVLVTGSSGLIGGAIASHLQEFTQAVIGLDRIQPEISPTYPTFEADLNDIHQIYSIMNKFAITHVIHCGAISGPMLARENPNLICDTNIRGTMNLLEVSRIMGVQRFVYCSSASAYGNTPPAPVNEEAPLRPVDMYGASKATGDILVQAYAQQNHVDGIALRLSWVYGPRRRTDCLIRTLIANARAGQPTKLAWGLNFYRQYIYINDVVSALVSALMATKPHQRAYNITGDSWLSISEVVETVQKVVSGVKAELSPGPDPIDCIQERFDISAAKRDLGYTPRYTLERGVEEYSTWLYR